MLWVLIIGACTNQLFTGSETGFSLVCVCQYVVQHAKNPEKDGIRKDYFNSTKLVLHSTVFHIKNY